MTPEVCLEQYGEWARRLIWKQTSGIRGIGPKGIGRDDMMQEGLIALMQALDRYEPQTGVPFEAYAKHVIKGRVVNTIRGRAGGTPLVHKDPVVASYDDIACLNNCHPWVVVDMESRCEAAKIIALFDRLNPRYRRVMRRYYIDDLQQQEIATIEGISDRRVWQIKEASLRKIRKMLGIKEIR